MILSHFDEDEANVVHDLEAKVLVRARHLVQRHPIQLDRPLELAEARVDVAHVDFEAARVAEQSVLGDCLVHVQRLLQQPRRLVLLRQVEQHLLRAHTNSQIKNTNCQQVQFDTKKHGICCRAKYYF